MASRATHATLVRLLLVVGAPASALTGCDDGPSADRGGNQGEAVGRSGTGGTSGAGGGEAGAPGAGGTSAVPDGGVGGNQASPELPPIPPAPESSPTGYPVCGEDRTSPSGFGYHGACCVDIECRAPSEDGLCPAPSLVQRGTGSGTCGCGTTEGPFAAGDDQAAQVAEGRTCCYLAGIIGCDGRPLLVDGIARVAALGAATEWGGAAPISVG
jgi:hypothetical protein